MEDKIYIDQRTYLTKDDAGKEHMAQDAIIVRGTKIKRVNITSAKDQNLDSFLRLSNREIKNAIKGLW